MFNMALATRGILGAKALDQTTVRIVCSRPKADMERIFIPILPKHVWSKVTPKAAETSFTNPTPIVGSGPFTVTEFVKGKFLRMVRNPNYYGTTPTVDEIVFATYQNPDTMTIDFKSGNLDAAWGIPVAQFRTLGSEPGIEALDYPYYNWEYLNFNCYDSSDSLGSPVLRDAKFRNAIDYAIDRAKLCAIAFQGYAAPGTTIVPPKTWKDPDYHWQPSATEEMGFDLAEAGRLLDEAGYPLKGGKRADKQGKQVTLRLYATSDNVPSQTEGKLITGWLQELGIKIQYSVLDPGALSARIWNYEGATYKPDFDLYIDSWLGYVDPGQTLTAEATWQIGATNEPCWSNAEYDKLADEQAAQLDPLERQQSIWRMQQIMYEQTPWVVVAYPDFFEAYRHRGLDGLDPRERRERPGVLHGRQRRHVRQLEAGDSDRSGRVRRQLEHVDHPDGGRRGRHRASSVPAAAQTGRARDRRVGAGRRRPASVESGARRRGAGHSVRL